MKKQEKDPPSCTNRIIGFLFITAIVLGVLVECGGSGKKRNVTSSSSTAPTSIPTSSTSIIPASGYVTKNLFDDDWPFTIDDGTVDCQKIDDVTVATFSHGSTVFALDAYGYEYGDGWHNIDDIVADQPNHDYFKKSIIPFFEAVEEYCPGWDGI